jgi:hypothetical protein
MENPEKRDYSWARQLAWASQCNCFEDYLYISS